jgi:SNF2-related domain/Helicase conserved C-terminal domain
MPTSPPVLDPKTVRACLASFRSAARRKGERLFSLGTVSEIEWVDYEGEYVATVADAVEREVRFFGDDLMGLDGMCTCPAEYECEHCYAVLKAFLDPSGTASHRVSSPTGSPAKAVSLSKALSAAWNRPLTPKEKGYVNTVRRLYQEASLQRYLTNWQLSQLDTSIRDRSWSPLHIWPVFPANEVQFWLYVAWELQSQDRFIPDFMKPVTDFTLIEAGMKEWQRQTQIKQWRDRLGQVEIDSRTKPRLAVDLRLVLGRDSAALWWRKGDGETEFKRLKTTQSKELYEAYQAGTLDMAAELLPLWNAVYDPFNSRQCKLDLTLPQHANALRPLLRIPTLQDRFFNEAGQPIVWAAGCLGWELTGPNQDGGDYQIRLVGPDGAPPSRCLFVLDGHPSYFVTETHFFEGPSLAGGVLDVQRSNVIPAEAFETRQGVTLLHKLGIDPPPHLAKRIRRVPLTVKMKCQVKDTNGYTRSESVFVSIEAKGPKAPKETYGANGWFASKGRAEGDGREGILFYDRSRLESVPLALAEFGLKWSYYDNAWTRRVTRKFPEEFTQWLKALPDHYVMDLDPVLASLTRDPVSANFRLECQEAGIDWFDLQVVLDVAETELTPEELKILHKANGGYVRLGGKGWRRLQYNLTEEEDRRLARLGLSAHELSAEPQRMHSLQLADDAASALLPEAQMEAIRRRARELKARVSPPVPDAIRAELRPYQVEGFHFLSYLVTNRFGGILADDMGLGKTLQTLTWLAWLRSQAGSGVKPALVVCPKSVMDTWRAEGERFDPGLRLRIWTSDESKGPSALAGASDLIVVNYAQLRLWENDLTRTQWSAVILDEGQYIKNPNSLTAKAACRLQAEHRLILTGTPIENRLLDLWSLMTFAMPGVLGNKNQFARRYDQKGDPLARQRLAARVRPFLLRRTKNQVATELPDRIEEDIFCELEPEQSVLYKAEFKRAQRMLLDIKTNQDFDKHRFHFLTSLLRLRQICCHPALVSEACEKADSAKVNALLELIGPLMEEGHKVLVFSQFVTMLDRLRSALKARKWTQFYLAGDTENRGPLVDSFQNHADAAVFLISLKAGGFGLNLTAASYVVLFDPWWNPAVENQAIDRTHRIGQTSKVMAYRLLIKNSIEEKIRKLQKQKSALAEDVLGEERFAQSLTLNDLHYLFSEEAN